MEFHRAPLSYNACHVHTHECLFSTDTYHSFSFLARFLGLDACFANVFTVSYLGPDLSLSSLFSLTPSEKPHGIYLATWLLSILLNSPTLVNSRWDLSVGLEVSLYGYVSHTFLASLAIQYTPYIPLPISSQLPGFPIPP